MANNPQFIGYATADPRRLNSAHEVAGLDGGSGTYLDVFTSTGSGALFFGCTITALGSTGVDLVKLYYDDGSSKELLGAIRVPEKPVGPLDAPWSVDWTYPRAGGKKLGATHKIIAATESGGTFVIDPWARGL